MKTARENMNPRDILCKTIVAVFVRKKHLLPKRKGERKRRKVIVWDEKECRQIREIYDRKSAGEPLGTIAIDFFQRGEKTGEGRPWVPDDGKRINRTRVYRAWRWYNAILDAGLQLGCDVGDERLLAIRTK